MRTSTSQSQSQSQSQSPNPRAWAAWPALLYAALPLAAFVYLYGLGCTEIPANGDEFVYLHIARQTALSGHWLPLRSELPGMQDTKPPLLFWQAMAAGSGQWTLGALRLPSVLYTLVSAALAAVMAYRLSGRGERGAWAALFYLGCFATYRYGRPLLTDPPETTWLLVPLTAVVLSRGRLFESRVVAPLAVGLCLGLANLYKSFALALPAGLALVGWLWVYRRHGAASAGDRRWARAWPADAAWIALALGTGVAVFGLWFAVDPDPGRVWREFVVGENAGKFHSGGGYVAGLLVGGSSVFSLALATIANGGLLAPLLVALVVDAWRRRRSLSQGERFLWVWVIALFLAFSLPAQRSGRYLLPAMPALAVLAALAWDRLGVIAVRASAVLLLLTGTALVLLGAAAARELSPLLVLEPTFWVGGVVCLGLAFGALVNRRLGWLLPLSSLASLLMLGAFARSYDAPPGAYSPAARLAVAHQEVYVPGAFVSSEEAYRFLLPKAVVRRYESNDGLSADALAARYARFAVRLPADEPLRCGSCRVLGERLVMHGRQTGSLPAALRAGRLVGELVSREYLVESQVAR